MFLLDFADVSTGDGDWMLGYEADDRTCGLRANLIDDLCEDPLDETTFNLVGDATTSRVKPYKVGVFGITGRFSRSLFCSASDDEEWLRQQMKAVQEKAVGRAMCVDHSPTGDTWIGGTGVPAVSLGGNKAEDVVDAGLVEWHKRNPGDPRPVLHTSYDQVRPLLKAYALVVKGDGELVTIWGNDVVISPGYLAATMFWSGPIKVHLSTIQVATLVVPRQNDAVVRADQYGAIDFGLCSIVRVGPTPTPAMMKAESAIKEAPHNTTHTIEMDEYKVGTPPPYEPVVTVMEDPVDIPQPAKVAVAEKPKRNNGKRQVPNGGTHVIETPGIPEGYEPPSASLNPPQPTPPKPPPPPPAPPRRR